MRSIRGRVSGRLPNTKLCHPDRRGAKRAQWRDLLFWQLFTPALLLFAVLLLSAAAPEKHVAVYSTVANYSLPIVQREGRDYVGLLELLDPLGTVNAKFEAPRWRLHYNNILGDFA